MAITYFGKAHNPASDGSDSGTRTTVTVTPPASMVTGDLVYVHVRTRGEPTLSVGVTGGQTWNPLANTNTPGSARVFWCRYNGTWDADPRFDQSLSANTMSAFMVVFRPTDGANTWDVDVAEVAGAFSAPGAPGDVTVAEITTLTDGAVVLVAWANSVAATWGLQTVGWTNPGSLAQLRELAGNDVSTSIAYQIKATAGATGAITNRQLSATLSAGLSTIIAFKEVAPVAAAATRTPMYARRRGR